MSIVKWRWKDDEENTRQYLVENTLYFPHSLINILSVTDFAKQLNNKEGTGIDTKQLRSCFYWDGNKHSLTISTPTHDNLTRDANQSRIQRLADVLSVVFQSY